MPPTTRSSSRAEEAAPPAPAPEAVQAIVPAAPPAPAALEAAQAIVPAEAIGPAHHEQCPICHEHFVADAGAQRVWDNFASRKPT